MAGRVVPRVKSGAESVGHATSAINLGQNVMDSIPVLIALVSGPQHLSQAVTNLTQQNSVWAVNMPVKERKEAKLRGRILQRKQQLEQLKGRRAKGLMDKCRMTIKSRPLPNSDTNPRISTGRSHSRAGMRGNRP